MRVPFCQGAAVELQFNGAIFAEQIGKVYLVGARGINELQIWCRCSA